MVSRTFKEEEELLIEQFFAQYSDEEMSDEMTDDEVKAYHEYMRNWLYEHASELLTNTSHM